MNDHDVRGKVWQREGGYSLPFLFLLVAFFALFWRSVPALFEASWGFPPQVDVLQLMIVGVIGGVVLGVIVGLFHHRRRRGLFWGLGMGVPGGAFAGLVAWFSLRHPQGTLVGGMVLAVIVLAVAYFFRRITDEDPLSDRTAYEAKLRQWGVSDESSGSAAKEP